jgi:hypothetical protein
VTRQNQCGKFGRVAENHMAQLKLVAGTFAYARNALCTPLNVYLESIVTCPLTSIIYHPPLHTVFCTRAESLFIYDTIIGRLSLADTTPSLCIAAEYPCTSGRAFDASIRSSKSSSSHIDCMRSWNYSGRHQQGGRQITSTSNIFGDTGKEGCRGSSLSPSLYCRISKC